MKQKINMNRCAVPFRYKTDFSAINVVILFITLVAGVMLLALIPS
jgi:hypothetical protein